MNEQIITLRKGANSWVATWHGDAAREIEQLFGAATIPTPFTVEAEAETVRAAIAQKNPGYNVVIESVELPGRPRLTHEQWTDRKAEQAREALARATGNQSTMNYAAIFEGFAAMGIAEADITPRENVFTFNAWRAKGRFVRKGEHGVKCVTWVTKTSTSETGEPEARRFCTNTTVFHVSQTEAF